METVEEFLLYHAAKTPNKKAIIVNEQSYSYNTLSSMVLGFSNYLITVCHIKDGDRVILCASQSLDFVIAYFSVHMAGGIAVPVEKNIKSEFLNRIIDKVKPKVIVGCEENSRSKIKFIHRQEVEKYAQNNYDGSFAYGHITKNDTADIMFTSGTTGNIKGVEISNETLLATAENYITGFQMEFDNVIIVPGPLSHVNPLRKLYTSIVNGSTIVILDGLLSIKKFFNALDSFEVDSLCLPPASLHIIWKLSGNKLSEYKDQIKFVECSTAPLLQKDKETLRLQLPFSRLYNNYGLSECGAMAMYDFNKYPDKSNGCVGKAMKNSEIVILDEEGREIKSSIDQMGIIANRGKINMKGYWNNKELTEKAILRGYVITNDIGYVDKEGYLFVMGRANDTINVGGLKVEPLEVEEVASSLSYIKECVCVPVPDDLTGSTLKLFVVLNEKQESDWKKLREDLSKKLENYKIPKYYECIESIPRNNIGKINRNAFCCGKVIIK